VAVGAAGIGTFDWNLITGVLTWDTRLDDLFGLDPGAFDQTIEGFNACLHPEDLPRVTKGLQDAIGSCGNYESEYRVVLPTGEVRWIAARGRALCDEGGTTVRMLGAAWDVTTRRLAQDRVAQILEGMSLGFVAVDREWVITHVNAEAERILGYPRSELLGVDMWEKFPAAVGSEFEHNYRRAADTGTPVTFDAYYPDPLNIWVEVRAVPSAAGLSLYFLDVTDRISVQQTAEQAARQEQLLSRVTEELGDTLDANQAATRLARLLVPALADWCIVTLVGDDRKAGSRGGLRETSTWHVDPAMRPLVEIYARGRLWRSTPGGVSALCMTTPSSSGHSRRDRCSCWAPPPRLLPRPCWPRVPAAISSSPSLPRRSPCSPFRGAAARWPC
jgi:PAS domain S-box-containing protein